jgi:hypothetical protein
MICTLVICSAIGSQIRRLAGGLADELDKIKEQLDRLERRR